MASHFYEKERASFRNYLAYEEYSIWRQAVGGEGYHDSRRKEIQLQRQNRILLSD